MREPSIPSEADAAKKLASKVAGLTIKQNPHLWDELKYRLYQENSPERIYFLMLYNIFSEFLEDITADVLPNDLTGYQDSLIWKKLFNFQRDAATGIINKLETFNGCILADSVGLGKTFTALAVVKYYELRNRSVLVLCPKKLADNWLTYKGNLVTNILMRDRFGYDVLSHTDLLRDSGASVSGLPLNRVNWGNYDLVVIDESHNFRNNDFNAEKETRYQRLLNQVIRQGVKTKVLMLSATPVNNRFLDLKNQLALAYEGNPENLTSKLRSEKNIDQIFRRAQTVFNSWSTLPPQERTAEAILNALDFDFFEVLDSVTIARSRRHIQTYYDTKDIGPFPERLKPLSFHCQLTNRNDVIGFNEIFKRLSSLTLAVYPKQAEVDRKVAKTKIFAHAKSSKSVKELFAAQVEEIVWKYKLSPETVNLPTRDGIKEIQVFEIALKTSECDESVIHLIEKAIPFPLLFQLKHGDQIRFVAAYKRPVDAAKWVVEAIFQTEFQSVNATRPPLPVALDLAGLYEHIVRRHIPLPPRTGESVSEQVARFISVGVKEKKQQELQVQLAREKQFNRKVELNAASRSLAQDLKSLKRI